MPSVFRQKHTIWLLNNLKNTFQLKLSRFQINNKSFLTFVEIKLNYNFTTTFVDMKLSDFETEVLQLFWQQKQASAPEIHKTIIKTKDVTYSTVKTIIDRLEKKGAIQRASKKGRTIFYTTSASANSMRKPMLDNFINKVFGGNSRSLMNHLIENESLSDEDLEYLKQVVNKDKSAP